MTERPWPTRLSADRPGAHLAAGVRAVVATMAGSESTATAHTWHARGIPDARPTKFGTGFDTSCKDHLRVELCG
jgi:hypothetical protein